MEELVREFSFEKVNKSGAVFNLEKLNWYNKQYIISLSDEELAERCKPFFQRIGLQTSDFRLSDIVALEKGRASTLVELVDNLSFVFADKLEYDSELLVWKKSTGEDAKEKLQKIHSFLEHIGEEEWTKENLEVKTLEWIKEQGFENGPVLWPVRVSLSGQKNSPGPFEIMAVLGTEKTLKRINDAIHILTS